MQNGHVENKKLEWNSRQDLLSIEALDQLLQLAAAFDLEQAGEVMKELLK